MTKIYADHGSHVVSVSKRWRRHMLEVGAWPKNEYHDFTGHHCHQQQSKRSERRDARLRVPRRKGAVHLSRVYAELVFDPVSYGVRFGNVRLSHVFLRNAG